MSAAYTSSIPPGAKERITKRYPSGKKKRAEYRVGRKVVGVRFFFESGEPELEYGMKDGKRHGIEYDWLDPGMLVSAEPFVDGLQHGTAKQWDWAGRLIGTYRMVRGTGIDLWRGRREDGTVYLSEMMHCKGGLRHGFQWFIEEDQRSVCVERHWREGQLHGIERMWNRAGRLRRGFPKYHVAGEVVSKRQYLKTSAIDQTLPSFRLQENEPARTFPPEIVKHLRP